MQILRWANLMKALIHKELDAKVGMGEISMEIIGEKQILTMMWKSEPVKCVSVQSYSGVGSGGSQRTAQSVKLM